jgi:hypothetical protein
MTNIILIVFLKFIIAIIPGMTSELSWTLTTLIYNIVRVSPRLVFFPYLLFPVPWLPRRSVHDSSFPAFLRLPIMASWSSLLGQDHVLLCLY